MIATELDGVHCFALHWSGVPIFSTGSDRSSAWSSVGILEVRGLERMSGAKSYAAIIIGDIIGVERRVEGHIHMLPPNQNLPVLSSRRIVSIISSSLPARG